MRFLLTAAALAVVASAKQVSQPGWDKYADERGFSHHEQDHAHGQGHGHGLHAREADPIAAWEKAHGYHAPVYNAHENEIWEHPVHYAGPAPTHSTNGHQSDTWEESQGAKPSHVARTLKDLYNHYSNLAGQAAEKAKEKAGMAHPHPSGEAHRHYARDARGKMVYNPHPSKAGENYFGHMSAQQHHARDVEDDDQDIDYSLEGYAHDLIARAENDDGKDEDGSEVFARDVEELDPYVDYSLEGYDHDLVTRDAEAYRYQHHPSICKSHGVICRAKRDVEDPENWDVETEDENGEPVYARNELISRRDVEDDEEDEAELSVRDAKDNGRWEEFKETMTSHIPSKIASAFTPSHTWPTTRKTATATHTGRVGFKFPW